MKFKHLKKLMSVMLALTVVVGFVMQAPAASACTALELDSVEGNKYWFRTCDMDNTYNVFGEEGSYIASSYLVSYPKDQAIPFTFGDMNAKYTVFGMSFSDSLAMLDGMNDAGLTGGLLFLNEGTETPLEDIPEDGMKLAAMEGVTYFLSQCKDVQEVIELASNTYMIAEFVEGIPGSDLTATLHFNFVDAAGNSVVLEAADPENPGRLTAYESVGVMTNSPPYDWQMDNLEDYVSDSAYLDGLDIDSIDLNDITLDVEEGGDDILPAGHTPPERLVRMAIRRWASAEGNEFTDDNMLAMGANLFSTVTMAKESSDVTGKSGNYTQYHVCYDIADRSLAIRPYDTLLWTTLSLDEVNTEARTTYPILRGAEGGTISTLTVQAMADGTTDDAESSFDVNMFAVCGAAVAAFILALVFQNWRDKRKEKESV